MRLSAAIAPEFMLSKYRNGHAEVGRKRLVGEPRMNCTRVDAVADVVSWFKESG